MNRSDALARNMALSVATNLAQHINGNVPTQKDAEILNPNGGQMLQRFMPRNPNNRQVYPQQQFQQPQFRQNPNQPPYNPYMVQQVAQAPPMHYGGGQFEPIKLPSDPIGFIPMDQGAQMYMEATGGKPVNVSNPPANVSEPPVDVSAPVDINAPPPSFKDTSFSAGKKTVSAKEVGSVYDIILQQSKEIASLKTKIGTLSTRVYKLLKILEEENE